MLSNLTLSRPLAFGDLVRLADGHLAICINPLETGAGDTVEVFVGNGLSLDVARDQIAEAVTLPGSTARTNFAERLAPEGRKHAF